MKEVLAAFLGAALSFPHCLGMCGGFALHLAEGSNGRHILQRQLCWHAGRIVTYVFLGSIAAFAGGFLLTVRVIPHVQNVLAVLLGAFMIVMGLVLMGLFPARFGGAPGEEGLFVSFLRQFVHAPTRFGALTLGLATGFLPCPIVLGFLALSAQGGSVLTGMTIMAAMGLGTVWSLLLLGVTGGMISTRLGRWSAILAGLILILLGIVTALRATPAFHRLLGCPAGVHRSANPEPQDAGKEPLDGTYPCHPSAQPDNACHDRPTPLDAKTPQER